MKDAHVAPYGIDQRRMPFGFRGREFVEIVEGENRMVVLHIADPPDAEFIRSERLLREDAAERILAMLGVK